MAYKRVLLGVVLYITFALSINSGLGIKPRPIRHYVNGRQGWVLHPFQDYNQWAGSNRFLPHDTLYFRYNKEEDSVVEVKKEDYESCNTDDPIEKKEDGESEFELNEAGPYYFISGNKSHCQQGQKLIVQVLHYPSSLPPPPSGSHHPPAATSPPATSPSSGTPVTPGSPATSPSSGTPVTPGPAMSPATSGPVSSPTSGPTSGASPPSPVAPGPGSEAPEAAGGPGSAETPSGQPSDLTAPSPSEKKPSSAVRSNVFSVGIGVLSVLVSLIMWLN